MQLSLQPILLDNKTLSSFFLRLFGLQTHPLTLLEPSIMSIGASAQSLARLEPFLLLAKSAKNAAAAKLITEVTSTPGCYVFSELLDFDGIQALAHQEEYVKFYKLLHLFAYGTFIQYRSAPSGTFPHLNEAQEEKLRHLTLISLGSKNRNLSYKLLLEQFDLHHESQSDIAHQASNISSSSGLSAFHPSLIRELEDVIIDAIYAGIISARFDQSRQRVEVESVMGRDVQMEEISNLSAALHDWQNQTVNILTSLSERIKEARKYDEDQAKDRMETETKIENTLLQLANNPNNATLHGSANQSSRLYDRLGSDRFNADVEMEDDSVALRKKK